MSAAIEVRNLHFRYGEGTHALRGISFAIAEGESVVFVGGIQVTPRALQDVRRKVGFLFQDPNDQIFCPRCSRMSRSAPGNSA